VRRTTKIRNPDNEPPLSIIKQRIADLEIYCPNQAFDYRISINLEAPWSGDVRHLHQTPEQVANARGKDRISYRYLAYQIDLTQITQGDGGVGGPGHGPVQKKLEHELELEIGVPETRRELDKLIRGEEGSIYGKLIEGFVNNVRILVREAGVVAGPVGHR
jgi:hypothetical protein